MISGPTEILVICDGSTEPDWIAMDLLSQAEHHETSQAILVSPDKAFLERVEESIERSLADMPRAEIIEKSLARRGALIKVKNLDEACEIANRIAPEHLELSVAEPKKWLKKIRHAGAIFLGRYSSEALGTTAPARITCCRLRARRGFLLRSVCTTSRSARASFRSRAKARKSSASSP